MRIPVVFGSARTETEIAWLLENALEPPAAGYVERFVLPPAKFGHIQGCNCCTPRGPAADALSRLYRARATGAAPFFKCVIVLATEAGAIAVREAVAIDIVTTARFYIL